MGARVLDKQKGALTWAIGSRSAGFSGSSIESKAFTTSGASVSLHAADDFSSARLGSHGSRCLLKPSGMTIPDVMMARQMEALNATRGDLRVGPAVVCGCARVSDAAGFQVTVLIRVHLMYRKCVSRHCASCEPSTGRLTAAAGPTATVQ